MSLKVVLGRVFSGTMMACFAKIFGIRQNVVEKAVKW